MALIVVAVVALVAAAVGHKPSGGPAQSTSTSTTATSTTATSTAQLSTASLTASSTVAPPPADGADTGTPADINALAGSLSKGYSLSDCTALPIKNGALAELSCGQNPMPGGPISARYMLLRNGDDLSGSFNASIKDDVLISCGDNAQSPNTWHQGNKTIKAGLVACGTYQNAAEVIWTTDAKNVLACIHAANTNVPSIYEWWRTDG
jgi:hypothetical protein